MGNKPQYVDLIGEATRQNHRRRISRIHEPIVDKVEEPPERKLLSNWPPARIAQWREETLTAWKLVAKSWKFKDWG